jgi:hypothetical protein
MLYRYFILHGLQKWISAKFRREQYTELAVVGRRRRRQDVAANEVAQIISTVGLENSLRSSDTWAARKAVDEDPKEYRKIMCPYHRQKKIEKEEEENN